MHRIVIIGGGFAGLMAARTLCRSGRVDVTLIDRRATSDFLPLLLDVAGGTVDGSLAMTPLSELAARIGFRFVQDKAVHIDRATRRVGMESGDQPFDYLIIAGGAETNFYGNRQAEEVAFRLDSARDAIRLRDNVRSGAFENYVIVGGGYTGVETATHLRRALNGLRREGRVILVEKSPSILGVLVPWMRDYVRANLARMKIEMLESCEMSRLEDREVVLSRAGTIPDALTVWVAGMRTPAFARTLELEHNAEGRLVAGETLQIADRLFVAGDAALFRRHGTPLRMSVQFARTQGVCAAANVLCAIAGTPLRPYRAFDPGYIVPMANGRSCGRVLGIEIRGRLPTLLHYLLCAYRSNGLRRKLGVLRESMRG